MSQINQSTNVIIGSPAEMAALALNALPRVLLHVGCHDAGELEAGRVGRSDAVRARHHLF